MVWALGEPQHPAATKIGGLPVWPKDQPLPTRGIWGKTALRFLGQFNFEDSRDLLPELPAGVLSLWITGDFPFWKRSLETFWVDPRDAVVTGRRADEPEIHEIPATIFHSHIYRTWDPDPAADQELLSAEVDHQFQSYRRYFPQVIGGTKIGGLECMPQSLTGRKGETFLCQLASIQPAPNAPFPWVNHEEPFTVSNMNHRENILMLGDMGAIAFHLGPSGKVRTAFECG